MTQLSTPAIYYNPPKSSRSTRMIYQSKNNIKPYNYDSYKYDDNIGIEGMIQGC